MKVAQAQPTPAHRAALSLHSLSEPDRHWVLEALGQEQQAALRPLLRELEELGIPREPELAGAFAAPAGGEGRMGAGALHALDSCGVRALAAILRAEPPGLAATLLASRSWPWRDQLLSELPAGMAADIERAMVATVPGGAVQAALLAELEPLLREQHAAAARPASLWLSLRRRLGGLGAGR